MIWGNRIVEESVVKIETLTGKRYTHKALVICVLLLVIGFSVFAMDITERLPPCLFREVTGIECPTCGMSRSLSAAARLDLKEAFRFHLMGPLLFYGTILAFLRFPLELILGRELRTGSIGAGRRESCIIFFSLWAIYWITRVLR